MKKAKKKENAPNKKRIHWTKIRDRYLGDETETLQSLSDEFGVSMSSMQDRSAKEKWPSLRREFLEKVRTKAEELRVSTEAKRRADQLKIADGMKALATEALAREMKDLSTNPKKRLDLSEIRLVLKDAAEIERKALGMPDVVVMSDDELNSKILRLAAELSDEEEE